MDKPLVRWWVVFSIVMVSVTSALTAGLASFITSNDKTHLSWLIVAIFIGASIHLGYIVFHKGVEGKFGATVYLAEVCTSLGLLGTIIGLILMISNAFMGLDVSDQASLSGALMAMSSGLGVALTTTLTGLSCSLLLSVQLAVVRERWRA